MWVTWYAKSAEKVQGATLSGVMRLALVFAARLDPDPALGVEFGPDDHRLAADLTVLYVGLGRHGRIDQEDDGLAAVRAFDRHFGLHCHGA
jgi:hypothetical protein